jgi:hypothetical protein
MVVGMFFPPVYFLIENLVLRAWSEIDCSALGFFQKSQIPSTKLQINHKFQNGSKPSFLFVSLNFGHAQRRRLRRVFLFVCFSFSNF